MPDRILVLGGSGFLGQNIQDIFRLRSINATFVGRGEDNKYDLLDPIKTAGLFNEVQPDIVINAAATVGGIEFNINNPGRLMRENLQMGMNVLDACRDFNVKRIYYISTCCSYPRNCPVPFREEDLWNGAEEASNSAYGVAKKAIIKMGHAYRQQYGLKFTCFIFANLYGKYDSFDDKKSHFIPAIIKKVINAKENGIGEVRLFGQGTATRDLLNCRDASSLLADTVLSHFDYPELSPINVGTGVELSVRDVAHMIKEIVGYQGELVFDGSVSDGQPRRCLDTEKVRRLLGFEVKVKFEEGLREVVEWYQAQTNF